MRSVLQFLLTFLLAVIQLFKALSSSWQKGQKQYFLLCPMALKRTLVLYKLILITGHLLQWPTKQHLVTVFRINVLTSQVQHSEQILKFLTLKKIDGRRLNYEKFLSWGQVLQNHHQAQPASWENASRSCSFHLTGGWECLIQFCWLNLPSGFLGAVFWPWRGKVGSPSLPCSITSCTLTHIKLLGRDLTPPASAAAHEGHEVIWTAEGTLEHRVWTFSVPGGP